MNEDDFMGLMIFIIPSDNAFKIAHRTFTDGAKINMHKHEYGNNKS